MKPKMILRRHDIFTPAFLRSEYHANTRSKWNFLLQNERGRKFKDFYKENSRTEPAGKNYLIYFLHYFRQGIQRQIDTPRPERNGSET